MPSFLASPRALLGNIAYYIALYMVFVITCAFIVITCAFIIITVNDIVSFFHFAMDSRELGRQVVVLCLGAVLSFVVGFIIGCVLLYTVTRAVLKVQIFWVDADGNEMIGLHFGFKDKEVVD
jgi:hypothetical protein